ncbi:hypothetical protein MSG72_01350 [Acinetobacter sp. IK22]|uniref:hypothetical protein n=1 Tax=unclassified Acinetobacter TaxID=196816 RepID=UPI002D1EFB40|nr:MULTISPECIES: hypothetical protein [unclassified Acinetobacter]MEB3793676.1 hypothetical protein [Acinetobacter sp. IK24]MEB3812954.1 hypothetical protein [Acinetobacter sp. IK22]MEB3832072.1 hypothetical protein [Acinetobacter sp. IK23]
MEFRQVVKNHCDISPVTNFLNVNHAKAAGEGKPLVVLIAPQERDRTKAQNRLYWMWLNQWAKRQGTDKDYEHLFFKKNFLAKIYDRDDVGQYKKTFKAVRELKVSKHPLYQDVSNGLCELMSTTDASTAQFTEYLNDIHAWCNKQGCYLEIPDDLKFALEK